MGGFRDMQKKDFCFLKEGIEGKGVFIKQDMGKNKKVFNFSKRDIFLHHKAGCHCKICCRCIQIGEYNWLYPLRGSYGWYLNHSCNPNCGIIGKDIVSIRNIKKGEEITIDYSTTNNDFKWKMNCKCNQKNCRKKIESVQFLSKKLFNKYRAVIPEYLRKCYLDYNF
jgi:hypothetical protein